MIIDLKNENCTVVVADHSFETRFTIQDWEIEERFVRSTGPGGQNVNKVSSAVELRFDVSGSPSLPEDVKDRLKAIAGRRLTKNGVLVLRGNRFRDQQRNREDVRDRLVQLLRRASAAPPSRRPTHPPRSSKERRLADKKAHSRIKRMRSSTPET